jgi:hypothetical protein
MSFGGGIIFKPNIFSLSIGINYENKSNRLGPFCWNDADLFDLKMKNDEKKNKEK